MAIINLTVYRLSHNLHTNRCRLCWSTLQSFLAAYGMEGGRSDQMGKRH